MNSTVCGVGFWFVLAFESSHFSSPSHLPPGLASSADAAACAEPPPWLRPRNRGGLWFPAAELGRGSFATPSLQSRPGTRAGRARWAPLHEGAGACV